MKKKWRADGKTGALPLLRNAAEPGVSDQALPALWNFVSEGSEVGWKWSRCVVSRVVQWCPAIAVEQQYSSYTNKRTASNGTSGFRPRRSLIF